MSTQNDNGFRTFLASGALSAFLAVDIQSDGTIKAAAGGVTQGIGVLQQDVADAGYAQVKLWTAPGTFLGALTSVALATPGNAIAVVTGGYFGVYTATTFPRIGVALTSASAAAGTVVEVAIPPTGRIVT
jgi:hypothetical protein